MSLTTTPAEIVARAEASGRPGLLGRHNSWGRRQLGDLVKIVNGVAFPSRQFNAVGRGLPLIRIRDVGVNNPATYFDGPYDDSMLVHPGDLLVGMDGDFRLARWSGPTGLLNQRVCRLVPIADELDERWLLYSLQGYLDAIWAETSSVTVKHLSSKSIAQVPLPLPPVEEQRRIVEVLEDHLSRLNAAAEALTSASRRSKSAERAGLDAFTVGPDALVPLGDLVERVEAGKSFGSAGRAAEIDEWGIIRVSAMTWGNFRPEENKVVTDVARVDVRHEIKKGDLLVSRANTSEYVGASVLVPETRQRLLLSDKSLRVVPKAGVDPAYLHAVLRAPRTRSQISALATGTKDSMRNISQGALLKVMVSNLVPAAQREAVARVDSLTASLQRLRLELSRAEARGAALRRSLLGAALSGQLTQKHALLGSYHHV